MGSVQPQLKARTKSITSTAQVFDKTSVSRRLGVLLCVMACFTTLTSYARADFTNQTSAAGLSSEFTAASIAITDFDGDGDLDFTGLFNPGAVISLYTSDGDLTFTDATSSTGLPSEAMVWPNWGDYDNDGDPDLATGTNGSTSKVHIFRNDGGTLVEAIVFSTNQQARISWVDYDLDGDIDLFIGYILGTDFELHRNNLKETGTADFTDVTSVTGLTGLNAGPNAGGTTVTSIYWADIDNDGDPDGYVACKPSRDKLLINQLAESGSATFQESHASLISNDDTNQTNGLWGDYDNDGDLDLFQSTRFSGTDKLYRNETVESGTLSFTDVTTALGVGGTGDIGLPSAWVDFDNDGDLDLFSGSPGSAVWALYRNDLVGSGSVGFTEVSGTELGSAPNQHQGIAFFDADGDGYLDFLLPGNGFPMEFYENNGSGNNWVELDLVGQLSSADALQSRVRIVSGSSAQLREVSAASVYGNTGVSKRLHFGLGSSSTIDSLVVDWPSGTEQVWTNLTVNQIHVLVEDVNDPPTVALSLTDTTLVVGSSSYTIDLESPSIFSDPDGDQLTYTVSSGTVSSVTAAVAGSVVTIDAVSSGSSEIVITAADGGGKTATDTLVVTSNAPPTWSSLSDTTLTMTLDTLVVDLDSASQDVDDGSLTYSTTSSDGAAIQATIIGSLLEVIPLGSGSSTVTVTADDGRGGVASTTLEVAGNTIPQVGSVADATLTVGQDTLLVDLDSLTVDDGQVGFAVSSTDQSVVSADLIGSVLQVVPLASGNETITYTVDDGIAPAVGRNFVVSVNRAPFPITSLTDTIIASGVTFSRSYLSLFDDEDGDTLEIQVASTDSSKAVATLLETDVSVTTLNRGAGSIVILATDPHGGTTSVSFRVTVIPAQTSLVLEPQTLDLGEVAIGAASVDTVIARNDGNVDLLVIDISTSDSTFEISTPSFSLSPAEELALPVTFTPQARGDVEGTLTLLLSDSSVVAGSLKGQGIGPAISVALPDTLDLGKTQIGQVHEYLLEIENVGEVNLETSVSVSGIGFDVSTDNLVVEPGATGTLVLSFLPEDTTQSVGALELTTNDVEFPSIPATIVAAGTEMAVPLLSPAVLDFGTVSPGHTTTDSLLFENTTSTDLVVRTTIENVAFASLEDSVVVPAGTSGAIALAFSPVDTGFIESVAIVTYGLDGELSTLLSGRGGEEQPLAGDPVPGWMAWDTTKDAQVPVFQTISYLSAPTGIEIKNDFGVYLEFDRRLQGESVVELWVDPKQGSSTNFSLQLLLDDGSEKGTTYAVLQKNETDTWFYNPASGPLVSFGTVDGIGHRTRVEYDSRTAEFTLFFDRNADGVFDSDDMIVADAQANQNVVGYAVRGIYLNSGRGGIGTSSYVDDLRYYSRVPRFEESYSVSGPTNWKAWDDNKDPQAPIYQSESFYSPPGGLEIRNDFGVYRHLPEPLSGNVVVDLWVDPREGSSTNFSVQLLLDDGSEKGLTYPVIQKNETDTWFYNPAVGSLVPFATVDGDGRKIMIFYDTASGEYSLFFDRDNDSVLGSDDLIASSIQSNSSVSGLPVIGIYLNSGRGGSGTASFIDDLRFYTPLEEPLPASGPVFGLDLDPTASDQGTRSSELPLSVGDIVVVDLFMHGVIGNSGFDVTFGYDPNHLRYDTFATSDLFDGGAAISTEEENAIRISVALFGGGTAQRDSGSGGQIQFEVLEGFEAQTSITLQSVQLGSAESVTIDPNSALVVVIRITDDTSADYDGDGEIGFGDFLIFASGFGKNSSDLDFDPRLDLDSDGEVGFGDFLKFATLFG